MSLPSAASPTRSKQQELKLSGCTFGIIFVLRGICYPQTKAERQSARTDKRQGARSFPLATKIIQKDLPTRRVLPSYLSSTAKQFRAEDQLFIFTQHLLKPKLQQLPASQPNSMPLSGLSSPAVTLLLLSACLTGASAAPDWQVRPGAALLAISMQLRGLALHA
jgi:hypothetical protein